jgi:hypothetical protein
MFPNCLHPISVLLINLAVIFQITLANFDHEISCASSVGLFPVADFHLKKL